VRNESSNKDLPCDRSMSICHRVAAEGCSIRKRGGAAAVSSGQSLAVAVLPLATTVPWV
jgi:hypothetical protein